MSFRDRVQVYKDETAAGGGTAGDTLPYPATIRPTQDALEMAGLVFNDWNSGSPIQDTNVTITRTSNDLVFKDVTVGTVTLSNLYSWLRTSGVLSPKTNSDTVAIGATAMSGTEVLRTVGGARFEGFEEIVPPAATGTPKASLAITAAAHTALTAGTEYIDQNFNNSRTVQFAAGAIATQRSSVFQAPTYAFVGASTITTAATLAVSGAPVQGTNATITNAYAFWVQSGTTRMDGSLLVAPSGSVIAQISGTSSDKLLLGANPAQTGIIGVSNNVSIKWRNFANSADIPLIILDNNNSCIIGDASVAGTASVRAVLGCRFGDTSDFAALSVVTGTISFGSTTNYTVKQSTPGSDIATKNLTIQSQAPFATASTNKTPGNLILATPSPVAGGSNGAVQVSIAGTTTVQISSTSSDFIALGGSTVPSSGVLRFANNVFVTAMNASGGGTYNILGVDSSNNLLVGATTVQGTTIVSANGGVKLGDGTDAGAWFVKTGTIETSRISATVIRPTGHGSDLATNIMTLAGQAAWVSATTNINGGVLRLQGGAAKSNGVSGLRGPVRIQVGADSAETLIEACEPVVGQRVVALCQIGSGISSTQMPSSSGDGVVFIADATVAPTVNSVGGGILYSQGGALKWRGSSGTVTTIANP